MEEQFDEGTGPGQVNGFGLECFAVSADPNEKSPGSWLFDVVWQTSQFAADRGDLSDLLAEYGLLTTELYSVGIPPDHATRFVNAEERVGVLLGLVEAPIPSGIDGPLSPIRLVNAKLLTLDELAFAVEGKEAARSARAESFRQQRLASSLLRSSAVPR